MRPKAALHISLFVVALSTIHPGALAQTNLNLGGDRHNPMAAAPAAALPKSQLRLRAEDLAASTADEALKWEDKESAVRIISQAADLLWDDYPDRCRDWLKSAWGLTATVSAVDADEAVRRFRSTSPQSLARSAVLNVAHRHDRELAEQLLEQLLESKEQEESRAKRGVFDDRSVRSEQLLNMAMALAEKDPNTSAELAEQSLADGVSFQLQGLLLTLRKRDEAAAGRVFDQAVNRLAIDFSHPSEGQILASYLFTPGRVASPGAERRMMLAVGTLDPAPSRVPAEDDPARTRRFLHVMQGVLISTPDLGAPSNPSQTSEEYMALARSLADDYRRYAPELWPPIAQRLHYVTPNSAQWGSPANVAAATGEKGLADALSATDEGQVDQLYQQSLETAAERERNPLARKLAYVRAALATRPEELKRGKSLASKVDDDDLRKRLVSFLVYRAALAQLEGGKVEEAVNTSTEAAPLPRAIILITAAQKLVAERRSAGNSAVKTQRPDALRLLSAAENILQRDDLPEPAKRVRVGLAAALAPLEPGRALDVFNQAVAAINGGAPFDFSDTSAPRIADLTGASDSLLTRIRNGYGLKDAVAPLALTDFEGTVAAAARLSFPTARGTCLLEIARTIIAPDKGK